MLSTAAGKATSLTEARHARRNEDSVLSRKVWLPKLLYDSIPYFYIASGIAAFFATLYITEWFWVLPHYVLFSAACLHLGAIVRRKRQLNRRKAPH
ncbi:MAG: hypothetical protein KJP16_03355 [Gammaproteobacteria bacterium]|nr:hypothetical protein [Gammaproteobacteria bacterium]NNL49831.1 hypothetical protein [Woeseiaceae bacterium]